MKLYLLALCANLLSVRSSASLFSGRETTLIGVIGKDFCMVGADSSVSQSIALQSSTIDKIEVLTDPFPHDNSIARRVGQQQTIVAAAAGDSADSSRLLEALAAQCAIREYEGSVGCDVEYISLNNGDEPHQEIMATSDDCLSVEAVAHLARGQIASALRSRAPLQVSLLVAGMQRADGNDASDEDHSFSNQLQQQVRRASQSFQRERERDGDAGTTDSPTDANQVRSVHGSSRTLLKPRLYWLDSYGALQALKYGAHGLGANFLLSILDQNYSKEMTREEALDLIQECFRQLRLRYVINTPLPPCIKCIDVHGCHVLTEQAAE